MLHGIPSSTSYGRHPHLPTQGLSLVSDTFANFKLHTFGEKLEILVTLEIERATPKRCCLDFISRVRHTCKLPQHEKEDGLTKGHRLSRNMRFHNTSSIIMTEESCQSHEERT
jgi:hypothetical protein